VPSRLRIVLAGGLGALPFAGVAWQVLHHLEGLRRLGHRVLYLEDTGRWPYDPDRDSLCSDAGPAVRYLQALMRRHGFEDAWAYRDAASGALYGIGERALARELHAADVLINLSGVTLLDDALHRIPARVYLETDPVLPQLEVATGRRFTIDLLASHTHHFTYGSNFGAPDCRVPIQRFTYRPTVPPVILDWWQTPARPRGRRPFTTVGNWRQREKDFLWEGRRLGWSKDVEFLRIAELPRVTAVPIELALAHEPSDPGIRQLIAAGWRIRSARPLSKDPQAYRSYIRASAGELSVAKEQNVLLRSGWFSDRTATYLAAGCPAVVQDTAFDAALPTGNGLLAFRGQAQAASALAQIAADYRVHSAAAAEIAREHLRAETVLGRMIESL
jgi:hypothetical protein